MKTFLKDLAEILLCGAVAAFAISLFFGAIYLGATEGNRDCWRGTARSADCLPFGECRQVDGHDRMIDVELNYARRHPECRIDWTAAKRREAEVYWATDGKDQ